RYAGGAPGQVISHWPEVVIAREGPAAAGRVQAWVVGPGGGTDQAAHQRLTEALAVEVPVLVDADGLTLLAQDEDLRARIKARFAEGLCTILTPHAGEFARLGFELSTGATADRIGAVRAASVGMGAVILLKGHSTVVAAPTGEAFVNALADNALATAGSGDVLSGLVGSLVAAEVAQSGNQNSGALAEVVACAALIHGLAGQLAAASLRPVTSLDVLAAVSQAIADLRMLGSDDG
ncbi:MAG: NAD(P)H-hydrate dehydratase, partial [Actinobacteria bacterium]|nr:NAD(P)H-hydrate dehydratase [Actinomycetota bacterium]